jgi:hypothetical protein
MSEEKKTSIVFDFISLKLTAIITAWAIIMMTFIVLTIPSYGWTTIFFDCAIIVGAATILIIVYEYSSGNKFGLPKPNFNYKVTTDIIIRVALLLIGVFIGSGAFLTGALLLVFTSFDPTFVLTSLLSGGTLMVFGIALIYVGIAYIKPLLMQEDDSE